MLNNIRKARSVSRHCKQLLVKLFNIIKYFHICLFSGHILFRASVNINLRERKAVEAKEVKSKKLAFLFPSGEKFQKSHGEAAGFLKDHARKVELLF